MPDHTITEGYTPGSLGAVASLHGAYYHEHWGFGLFFEAKVASELASFLERYDHDRDGFWTASMQGHVQGSIAIDGSRAETEGAHLRWFIVSNALRGNGVGTQLMRTAMDFCRDRGYDKVYLWTFDGLHAARHLYLREGFKLIQEHAGDQWGVLVNEQKMECDLPSGNGPNAR